jgi:hypothetical protein
MYMLGLATIGLISLVSVGLIAPRVRRAGIRATGMASGGATAFNAHMFFMGMAFMLLETRSLVTFALLFGSTWLVNSLVFFAVLTSVLIAVAISARLSVRPSAWLYAVLLGGLVLAYQLPADALLDVPNPLVRYGLATGVAFLPVAVANLVFAGSFKEASAPDVAFASNLLGIMAGGMLEYTSLLIGYRHLLLLVIAFYLIAAVLWRLAHRHTSGTALNSASR